jgi:hypothetical protein
MTAQVPDAIENKHPDVHFGDLKLYALARGEIRSNRGWGEDYELPADPAPGKPVSTACYRGFRSCFRLEPSGEMVLCEYEYPFTERPPRVVNEKLKGDFFLVMKEYFRGRRTYVPFVGGRIVADRSEWLFEPEDGWKFDVGEHRGRPSVDVTPDLVTGNTLCPACNTIFSVCDPRAWDGARHQCGQSLLVVLRGERLPKRAAVHRDKFDQVAVASPDPATGRVECPRCMNYFLIRAQMDWDGERHACGQRISLVLNGKVLPKDVERQAAAFRPSFDVARIKELSRPILEKMEARDDGATTSGSCPSCGSEGKLRVCDGRVVLCPRCYFGVSGRPWMK